MAFERFKGRERKDNEFAEEIASHIAHEEDGNRARGLTEEEARRQARVRFGNTRSIREQEWSYRSLPWLEDFLRDLRFALRVLAKSPGFTIVAVLVIAIGIGVNTAVFSAVDTVLLKPLSYPNAHELVSIVNTEPRGRFPGGSIPKFNLWRQQTQIFAHAAAYDFGGAGINLTGSDHPQQVEGLHVSADYFAMFGAPVVAGRTFTAAEDSPNGGHVVVLSNALWKSRYGANQNIVGGTIQLDGQPYQVVGVIGPGFYTETPTDLWLPFQFDLNSKDMVHYFTATARLKPGVTVQQAEAQMHVVADRFRSQYGTEAMPADASFGVTSLEQQVIGDTRTPLMVLWGAVGFVLLIACANVANLLLAKGAARRREFATRAALGAGRAQIIRQLLVESLLLSFTGGAIGLAAGFTAVRLLLRVNPGYLPRVGENAMGITLDLNIVLFTLGLSLLTGVVFGLLPAISISRGNLVAALNEGGNRASSGVRSGRVRAVLVILEMALTVVLVVGAGLLVRTFMNLQSVEPGFTLHNVLSMTMAMTGDRFQTTAPVAQVMREGTNRLRAIPGVLDAGVSNGLPMAGGFGMGFEIVGRPKGSNGASGGAVFYSISDGYLTTLQIPLLRGRNFTQNDDAAAPPVVIINQRLAQQYWHDGDPLRDRMWIGAGAGPAFAEKPRQVIGVVGDIHDHGPGDEPAPMMYIPLAQMPDAETALNSRVAPLYWFVRAQVDPRTLTPLITSALRDASAGLPVGHIRTMEQVEGANIGRQRLNMLLLGVFSATGLFMAAIGIYGVMAYSVEQRTSELGVRMALGATAGNLRNMVLRQGMVLVLAGVVVGTGSALGLTHFLGSFLFGVKPLDLASFLAAPVLLSVIALISIWVPAVRATRVDPMTALRTE